MPRNGRFPLDVEDGLNFSHQTERGIHDPALGADCRSGDYSGFVQPWAAMSSLDNWGEEAETPNGLSDGDQPRFGKSYRREEDLYADIFGHPISDVRACEVDEEEVERFLAEQSTYLEEQSREGDHTENSGVTLERNGVILTVDKVLDDAYDGRMFGDSDIYPLNTLDDVRPKFTSNSPEIAAAGRLPSKRELRMGRRDSHAACHRRCHHHTVQRRTPFHHVTAAKRRRITERIVHDASVYTLMRGQVPRVVAH